jgi:hypothetical protein
MQPEMSVSRLQAELEGLVSHHERQEKHHAEQEVFHREERAKHATALAAARERLEAYRAAAEAAGELVARSQIRPAALEDDLPPGEPVMISRLAARVIAAKDPAERFGAAAITREINQRYGKRLRRPASERTVATALRRMANAGRIVQMEKGRGHHEGVYLRGVRKG